MNPRQPNQPHPPGVLIPHLPYPSPNTCGTTAHLHCEPGTWLSYLRERSLIMALGGLAI